MRPHDDFPRLATSMGRLLREARPWEGRVFRSVSARHAKSADLVSGAGSRRFGGRWNPPGYATVYGCLTPEVAMAETLAHYHYYGIRPWQMGRRMFCVLEVRLAVVLDLTRGDLRRRLRVSRRRMRETDWRRSLAQGEEALTQALGRAAYAAGFEGLLVPSAPAKGGTNLVAFPSNLGPGSQVAEMQFPA